jgi:hypothetical protein
MDLVVVLADHLRKRSWQRESVRPHALARDQYWFDAVSPEHSYVSDGLPGTILTS